MGGNAEYADEYSVFLQGALELDISMNMNMGMGIPMPPVRMSSSAPPAPPPIKPSVPRLSPAPISLSSSFHEHSPAGKPRSLLRDTSPAGRSRISQHLSSSCPSETILSMLSHTDSSYRDDDEEEMDDAYRAYNSSRTEEGDLDLDELQFALSFC